MKVLTIVGKDAKEELIEFHIVNPMNVVIHTGTVSKPGTLTDGNGDPIPVEEARTFVRVGGQPLFSVETVDEVITKVREL